MELIEMYIFSHPIMDNEEKYECKSILRLYKVTCGYSEGDRKKNKITQHSSQEQEEKQECGAGGGVALRCERKTDFSLCEYFHF